MLSKTVRIMVWTGMFALVLTTLQLGCASPACPDKAANENTWTCTFDGCKVGAVPSCWTVAATKQSGPLATWKVIADETAPSGKQVLALTNQNHKSRSTYNLCWKENVAFLDGEIEVSLKAGTGKIDQGGGVIWRAVDKSNYYIARWNPLEDNLRIYYVKAGQRSKLASTAAKLPADKWHTLRIVHKGNLIVGYINGKKMLELTTEHFSKPGGVGLWTKADAVTSFDNFTVVQK